MLKRRILLAGCIVAAGVFASFFGGAARTLFYITLLIPVFSLLYTFYVYLRFCIYQEAESKLIVKGEKTPYFFVLSDEDCIAYTDIRVEFLEDFSTPQNMELSRSYHLIPGERNEYRTEILCRYRGEYNIGVKSVVVTDLLGLLRIRYPAPCTLSMSVLPRIHAVEKISLAPLEDDAKLLRFSHANSMEPPDCDLRRYVQGDSIRRINWKVSAKKRELLIRQSSEIQNMGIVLILDLSFLHGETYDRIITEDKIIESALTIADFLVKKRVPLTIVYEQGEIIREPIGNPEQLKQFYGKCAAMKFCGTHTPSALCEAMSVLSMNGGFVIFAVSQLTEALCNTCEGILRLDGDAAVLLAGDEGLQYAEVLDKRVDFRHMALSEEVAAVLGGAEEHEKTTGR